jgi:hypothetical protein
MWTWSQVSGKLCHVCMLICMRLDAETARCLQLHPVALFLKKVCVICYFLPSGWLLVFNVQSDVRAVTWPRRCIYVIKRIDDLSVHAINFRHRHVGCTQSEWNRYSVMYTAQSLLPPSEWDTSQKMSGVKWTVLSRPTSSSSSSRSRPMSWPCTLSYVDESWSSSQIVAFDSSTDLPWPSNGVWVVHGEYRPFCSIPGDVSSRRRKPVSARPASWVVRSINTKSGRQLDHPASTVLCLVGRRPIPRTHVLAYAFCAGQLPNDNAIVDSCRQPVKADAHEFN